jgi:site-specific recombinase XerD
MHAAAPNALARTLRAFFGDYLPAQRGVSRHTLHSYRDTLTLLLRFLAARGHCAAVTLDLAALSPEAILAFLDHLEHDRHNTISSRNVRLAALHAFFRYVATAAPEHLEQAQRIVGIPVKRTQAGPIDYLEEDEIRAVLGAIDRHTRAGGRDYALLALCFNTGARVQELVDLNVRALQLAPPPQVTLVGKGRTTRICPLWPQTAQVLTQFVAARQLDLHAATPLFCNQRGGRLTRFGVRYLLAKYCRIARATCPSLVPKRLHPHSARHSTAMLLLKAGVDLVTISHWLGHASVNTTNRYATADLAMKRQAIARAGTLGSGLTPTRAWPPDASVLAWLKSL